MKTWLFLLLLSACAWGQEFEGFTIKTPYEKVDRQGDTYTLTSDTAKGELTITVANMTLSERERFGVLKSNLAALLKNAKLKEKSRKGFQIGRHVHGLEASGESFTARVMAAPKRLYRILLKDGDEEARKSLDTFRAEL